MADIPPDGFVDPPIIGWKCPKGYYAIGPGPCYIDGTQIAVGIDAQPIYGNQGPPPPTQGPISVNWGGPYKCGVDAAGNPYPYTGVSRDDKCRYLQGPCGVSKDGGVGILVGPNSAPPPPDPGWPPDCILTWVIDNIGQGAPLTGDEGIFKGTFQQYLSSWLAIKDGNTISGIAPVPGQTTCSCDTAAPPQMPPCTFCQQTPGTNLQCPVCTNVVDTKPIADAIKALLDELKQDHLDCDNLSTDCLKKLAKAVKDEIDSEGPTCQECCQMITEGVSLSASEALICASCECTNAQNQCSPGLGHVDGETCQGCGQSPCCCQSGECVPCEQQPQQTKYVGWYNCNTGESAVSKEGEEAFGPPWIPVGPFPNGLEALAAAESAAVECSGNEQIPPSFPPPPTGGSPIPSCDLSMFGSDGAISTFLGSFDADEVLIQLVTGTAGVIEFAKPILQTFGPWGAVASGIGSILTSMQVSTRVMTPIISNMLGCSNGASAAGIRALSFLGMAQQFVGTDVGEFAQPIKYGIHAACRNIQLSPDSAMSAYLSNQISYAQLDTHWAINGLCPESVRWASQSSRSKPTPFELIQLVNRGEIDDQGYADGMRQLGYTDTGEVSLLRKLGTIVPPYSDLVRMMVRDVVDDNIVNTFSLDTDFENKYQGQLKTWAKAQGVPDIVMQYLWRAHWSIPAPGQLLDFYHRFRQTGQFGSEQDVLKNVSLALEQQDIAPFWIPYFLAASFHPLTRIDARRAYQVGSIDDQTLLQSYYAQGYSDENADILLRFSKRIKSLGVRNEQALKRWVAGQIDQETATSQLQSLGYSDSDISNGFSVATGSFINGPDAKALIAGEITAEQFVKILAGYGARGDDAQKIVNKLSSRIVYNPAVDEYEAGVTTAADAINDMVAAGMSESRAQYFINRADGRLRIAQARSCATAVRKQFLTGGVSAQDAAKSLQTAGIVQERASTLVSRWQCELSARTRQPSISLLCRWLAEGSITPQDYIDRARRLGFSADDAIALLTDCNVRVNAAKLKAAAAQARQAAQAQAKAEAQARREAAAIERNLKQLAQAREQRAKASNRRQKNMFAIVDKILKLCACPAMEAVQINESMITLAQDQFGLDIDNAIEVVTRSVDAWDGVSQVSLTENVVALGKQYQDELNASVESTEAYPLISNGSIQPS